MDLLETHLWQRRMNDAVPHVCNPNCGHVVSKRILKRRLRCLRKKPPVAFACGTVLPPIGKPRKMTRPPTPCSLIPDLTLEPVKPAEPAEPVEPVEPVAKDIRLGGSTTPMATHWSMSSKDTWKDSVSGMMVEVPTSLMPTGSMVTSVPPRVVATAKIVASFEGCMFFTCVMQRWEYHKAFPTWWAEQMREESAQMKP